MNIYDFAGNNWEYTLEKTTYRDGPCTVRGGCQSWAGFTAPASYRNGHRVNECTYSTFRATFY